MTMTLSSTTTRTERTSNACENCAIRAHCLSANMNQPDLVRFQQSRGQLRIVRKGEQLFHAGMPFEALYIVRSGTIKATSAITDGTEQISGFYLPGELVGLDGIETREHVNTAEALETSSVCVFPFTTLMALAQDIQMLQQQLWHHASHEITSRQRLLMTIGRRSAEGRVAEFLLSISGRFKRFGYSDVRFRLPMSRQDIAAYLGLSVETVCRVLTRFQETGFIKREQREIELVDMDGLKALSVGGGESGHQASAPQRRPAQSRRPQPLHAIAAG